MSQDNDIEQSMTANDVTGVLADQSEVLLDTAGGERLHGKPMTSSGGNASHATR